MDKLDFERKILEDLEIKEPSYYKVIIYNDEETTMDFVVEILIDFFNKEESEAQALMYQVHLNGRGIAGIYIYDIALTKKELATDRARQNGFPLKIELEENVGD